MENIIIKDVAFFKFKHNCGNEFTAQFKELRRSFLNSGGGCPVCANNKRGAHLKVTTKDFFTKFKVR